MPWPNVDGVKSPRSTLRSRTPCSTSTSSRSDCNVGWTFPFRRCSTGDVSTKTIRLPSGLCAISDMSAVGPVASRTGRVTLRSGTSTTTNSCGAVVHRLTTTARRLPTGDDVAEIPGWASPRDTRAIALKLATSIAARVRATGSSPRPQPWNESPPISEKKVALSAEKRARSGSSGEPSETRPMRRLASRSTRASRTARCA